MKSLWKCLIHSTLIIAAAVGMTATLAAQENQQAGIVRISSSPPSNGPVIPVSATLADGTCINPNATAAASGACNPGMPGAGCEPGTMCDGSYGYGHRSLFGRHSRGYQSGDCWGSEFDGQGMGYGHGFGHCRSGNCRNCNGALCEYLKCKFGYFIPTGGGGQGIPWVGHYSRVYPVNPYYNDAREGQAYAAQGYGVPISVPLAPVVGHTYEYGWGVPSSRLVPVSRPAY